MPARVLFADSFYWVALLNPGDAFHSRVKSLSRSLGHARLVTTDDVLTETLNWFAQAGAYWRAKAAMLARDLRTDPAVAILAQDRSNFDAALAFYEARPDKGYSLTDCRSMLVMRTLAISEILTNDRHFTQEGFVILFP